MGTGIKPEKLLVMTAAGGALEFYDFTLFMLFAPYIRSAFFPEDGGVSGLLGVMGFFFAGYVARPLGGIIFSHYGDRYGRRRQFILTISLMSLCTLGIGVLPSKEYLGSASMILLMVLRMLQGASLGGEIPGSVTYMAEWLPRNRRGRYIGVIITSVTCGNLLGALAGYLLTQWLTPEQMGFWGWRLPFLLGAIMGMMVIILRRRMSETPAFRQLSSNGEVLSIPLLFLLKHYSGKWFRELVLLRCQP